MPLETLATLSTIGVLQAGTSTPVINVALVVILILVVVVIVAGVVFFIRRKQ
ncbi:MAG TPA: hypothetical protein VIG76_12055 [Amnibacterium sp.]|jgi:ABC-type multidrug transport system permease subunit|uniref:hypothetical protein n=1 Tax=Amnibacterium sp. TaxID=1872496 RepID=UPI002F92D939